MFKLRWLTVAIISTLLVVALTHIPQKYVPEELEIFSADKILHVISYGLITSLFLASIKKPTSFKTSFLVITLLAAIAGLDEYTQLFVGRTASLIDWAADILGIILAVIIWGIWQAKKSKQSNPIDQVTE
ncbi:MAG: VanZ family protein [Planctomycetota bacterium]